MLRKVDFLLCDGLFNWDTIDDVFLSPILHSDITLSQRHFLIHNHLRSISAPIHDIDLSHDSNGSQPLRINLLCHLQRI